MKLETLLTITKSGSMSWIPPGTYSSVLLERTTCSPSASEEEEKEGMVA